MPDKQHVFFAGCTGEIGKRLLNNLIAHNQVDEIHLLVRRPLGIENPKVVDKNIAAIGRMLNMFFS